MTDQFAALGEPRRPWLNPDELREKFHRLASEHHPDIARSPALDFALLNTAHAILREPHSRIRHLLDLEFPGTPIPAAIPGDIGDLFMEISQHLRALAEFRSRQEKATSPLARALLAEEKGGLQKQAEEMFNSLSNRQTNQHAELRALDSAWPDPSCAPRLTALQPQLAYLAKWAAQLREALHHLDL